MVDYPGLLCVTLFTPGCNLRCPFCHNSPLVLGGDADSQIEEEELLEFLKERKGRLDGVCITGGEPLLQKNALPFLEKLKIQKTRFIRENSKPNFRQPSPRRILASGACYILAYGYILSVIPLDFRAPVFPSESFESSVTLSAYFFGNP